MDETKLECKIKLRHLRFKKKKKFVSLITNMHPIYLHMTLTFSSLKYRLKLCKNIVFFKLEFLSLQ